MLSEAEVAEVGQRGKNPAAMHDINIHDLTFMPFISAKEINEIVTALARHIDTDYTGRHPVLLVVLNGAFIFAADLARKITIPVEVDFVKVSSYQGTSSSGQIHEHLHWSSSLQGKDVLIVEDIVDTGHTLHYLLDQIQMEDPASVEIVCLLRKPGMYQYDDQPRYEGRAIPDKFVVGYGLDYHGLGRDLESIYCLRS